jgi:predicted Zn-dependent protease
LGRILSGEIMKKIVCLIGLFLISSLCCVQASTTNWTTESGLKKVSSIGKTLLSKNNLPTQITFKVIETDEINAYASGENEICVYTGLLKYVDNDTELAGVIAHEMGHIINHHVAKQSVVSAITSSMIANSTMSSLAKTNAYMINNLTMLKMSRSEEYEADITGVDLMKNAGYNTLGMVSVLYKISGKFVDVISTHPSGDKRTMYLYNYITYAYPNDAKQGYTTDSYKQFMVYASPIVSKRNSSTLKQNAFNRKQARLQKKRLAKMEKYKNSSQGSGWTSSYTLLKSLTPSSSQ